MGQSSSNGEQRAGTPAIQSELDQLPTVKDGRMAAAGYGCMHLLLLLLRRRQLAGVNCIVMVAQ